MYLSFNLKNIIRSLSLSIPLTLIFCDNIAYIARVDGVSMQPTLNPYDEDDNTDNSINEDDCCDNINKKLNRNNFNLINYLNSSSDLILLSHWSTRNYQIERGDIVSLISPKNPNHIIIKRIIGIEGDIVVTRRNFKFETIRIPKGHCWVEGDNYQKSMDSNIFGPISVGLITAQAKFIIWPPKRWQILKNQLPNDRQLHKQLIFSSNKKFNGTYYNGNSYIIDLKTNPLSSSSLLSSSSSSSSSSIVQTNSLNNLNLISSIDDDSF